MTSFSSDLDAILGVPGLESSTVRIALRAAALVASRPGEFGWSASVAPSPGTAAPVISYGCRRARAVEEPINEEWVAADALRFVGHAAAAGAASRSFLGDHESARGLPQRAPTHRGRMP